VFRLLREQLVQTTFMARGFDPVVTASPSAFHTLKLAILSFTRHEGHFQGEHTAVGMPIITDVFLRPYFCGVNYKTEVLCGMR